MVYGKHLPARGDMTCSSCVEIAGRQFDETVARRNLRGYRRRGPDRPTRILLEGIRRLGLTRSSLLDVGGGVGVIHHELLNGVIARAVHVEASRAYLAAARSEAEARGHAEQVEFVEGDFVELAPGLPAADLVTLNRVICCYPDLPALVTASTARAGQAYALSYPREKLPIKLMVAVINLFGRLRGTPFRVFVHPEFLIQRLVREAGFAPAFESETLVWRIVVYRRGRREEGGGTRDGRQDREL